MPQPALTSARRSAWARSSHRRRIACTVITAAGVTAGVVLAVTGHSSAAAAALALLGLILAGFTLTAPTDPT